LTAQAKYDFLAAAHTMDQIQDLIVAMEKRAGKRQSFRERVIASLKSSVGKILSEKENDLTLQDIDGLIKLLTDCRTELVTLEGEEKAERSLKKFVADGITAK